MNMENKIKTNMYLIIAQCHYRKKEFQLTLTTEEAIKIKKEWEAKHYIVVVFECKEINI